MIRYILITFSLVFIISAVNGQNKPSVLLVAAESNVAYRDDVVNKLNATGSFSTVALFDAVIATPTVNDMLNYDVVLVWSDNVFFEEDAIGDNLAAYIEQGGNVITMIFTFYSSNNIGGAFATNYQLIQPGSSAGGLATLGNINVPLHPLTNNISVFSGGVSSFRASGTVVNGDIIAEWDDGLPLIVAQENVGPALSRRVDLNFWPVSSDAFTNGWDATTQGVQIMENAIIWVTDPFRKVITGEIATDIGQSYDAAWADYDNDGFQDLFVPERNGSDKLYRNNGNGTFTVVVAGDLGADTDASFGASWADYDNDGDPDLFVAVGGFLSSNSNRLYQNNGDGTFTSITAGDLGLDAIGAYSGAWVDYNNDGFLDLAVGNYNAVPSLYHNNGDGTFSFEPNFVPVDIGESWSVDWGDFNGDNRPDLYVSNYGAANILYRNDGGGFFTKITTGPHVTDIASNYSASWIDIDNDGDEDIFIPVNGSDNKLYINDGTGVFTADLTNVIVTEPGTPWSASWGDFNNDGWKDLYIGSDSGPGTLFRNDGGTNFTKMPSTIISRDIPNFATLASTWVDIDNDGDLDLFTAVFDGENKLYINEINNGNNWIDISLEGTLSNLSGVGAKLKLTNSFGNTAYQSITTQNGRGQSSTSAHFGLGSSTIRNVAISWPSGLAQSVKASNNQFITVVEGATDDRPSVLLLAADDPMYVDDVKDKLISTGEFSIVAHFNASISTPTLSELQAFDAVFVWSQNNFENATVLGDVLADYIDGGGPVVSAVFSNASIPIDGRYTTGYEVIEPLGQTQGVQLMLGTVLQPEHPLMNLVTFFDGGLSSFKSTSTTITAGSQIIAEWSDGTPLIVSKEGVGTSNAKRVDLNFWPVSSDVFTSNWNSSTDGVRIMTNALLWAMSPPDQFTKLSSAILNSDMSFSWGNSWGDYNGDGHLDLFVGNSGGIDFLYQNNGDGTFTKNSTDPSTLIINNTDAAIWGDYDNDGNLDLFVTNDGGNNILYRNDGNGVLVEAINFGDTDASVSAAWGDYNNDGFLDLFVGSGGNNRLYKNNQDGTFVEIVDGTITDSNFYSYGVSWADYDDDGFLDLFIAEFGGENILLHNNGDETFTRINGEIVEDISSVGVSWGDYDNDGDQDLFVANYSNENNALFSNNGDGTFTKIVNQIIVLDATSSLASTWADFNNDGYLDLFVTTEGASNNLLYQNNGDGTFESIKLWAPTNDPKASYGASAADYDEDGDIDLFVATQNSIEPNILYQNNGNSNNWINIVLEGVESNRSAIGAKVYITTSDGIQFREITSLTGFGSQNSLNVEFGLAAETIIDEIEINWPSGRNQFLYNVNANQFITILEDVLSPIDFQVGDVVTIGGNVVASEWNSTNTSVDITVPIDNDISLDGGSIQIIATIDGGSEENIGVPNTILSSNLGGTQIVSITKSELEALTGFAHNSQITFNATLTDVNGNPPTKGTASATTLLVNIIQISIASENFPTFFDVNGGPQAATITLEGTFNSPTVEVEYGLITQPSTSITTVAATTTDNITYRFDLNVLKAQGEALGVGYIFRISEGGVNVSSNIGVTHLEFLGTSSPTIPSLKFGEKVTDYQIISIPLELNNSSVSAVFEDDLGAYDDSKWRLFHYQGGSNSEKKSGSMEPGKGYWLIAKNSTSIDVGMGNVPQVTKASPYQITLSSGWNQIGNPYNFNLSWSDILAFNGNPAGVDSQLSLYEGGFVNGDVLDKFRGAFVNASSSITLDIPVVKNNSIQGRKGGDNGRTSSIDSENWVVDLDLKAGDLVYQLGGFGMNSKSLLGKDMNDLYTVPRFIDFLEINFQREGAYSSPLTLDVVPTAENFKWDFTVNSNLEGQELTLHWDNTYWGDSEKKLILFDEATSTIIDMRERSEYHYNYSPERKFQLVFGDETFVQDNLSPKEIVLRKAYPNPFSDKIFIPLGLPDYDGSYQVKMEIFDQMGRKIKENRYNDLTTG